MEKMTIGILGFGKLGSIIASRLVDVGCDPKRIRVVVRPSNRAAAEALGVTAVSAGELGPVDLLLVTVKPDAFDAAWGDLGDIGDPLVVSCMSRGTLETIAAKTGSRRVARLMTSTPCRIGQGVGAWIARDGMDGGDREILRRLALALGTHVEAKAETEIPYATTLSTVNGLVYLIVGHFQDAMRAIGAPPQYVDLVVPTFESAIAMLRANPGVDPVKLADDVTSKKGGTEAARKELDLADLLATIRRAVVAAYRKYIG